MSIPFIRQLPNGRRQLSEFHCSTPEIEHEAQRFIALEGAYVCEILPDGITARIAACMFFKGVQQDVEVVTCLNGPALPGEVEKLILASAKHVGSAKVLPFKRPDEEVSGTLMK